jgi:hypothetical protein
MSESTAVVAAAVLESLATATAWDTTSPQGAGQQVATESTPETLATSETPGTAETSIPAYRPHRIHPKASTPDISHSACKADLDRISLGLERNPVTGGSRKKNARLIPVEMWERVKEHFLARGKFFRCGTETYYLDEIDHLLIPISRDSSPLHLLLLKLGYLPTKQDTNAIIRALLNFASEMPLRTAHRLAFFSDDAIYVWSGENRMIRIRADEDPEEVATGVDGVVLLATDLAPWPDLETVLKPIMEEMHSTLGRACTQVRPDLPLSKLTTRWAQEQAISAEMAHQFFTTRFLFCYAASRYSLWPLLMLLGEHNTGKSTASELILTLLTDDLEDNLQSFPGKEDNLVTGLADASICLYDNVEDVNLFDPQNSAISDLICGVATGMKVRRRKKYSDGENVTFKIKSHAFLSSRINPFTRPDVLRRTIVLETEPADVATTVSKKGILKAVKEARPQILAEILLRLVNIVRAHHFYGEKQYQGRSEMVDYEIFTYRCAEYEGTLAETESMWDASRARYQKTLTEGNPLNYCISIWLGEVNKQGTFINLKRAVSPSTLWGELKGLFCELRTFKYDTPISLGKGVTKNLPSLRTLGFDYDRTRGGRDYIFDPNPAALETCQQMYQDFKATVCPADITRSAYGFPNRRNPSFIAEDAADFEPNPNPKPYKN